MTPTGPRIISAWCCEYFPILTGALRRKERKRFPVRHFYVSSNSSLEARIRYQVMSETNKQLNSCVLWQRGKTSCTFNLNVKNKKKRARLRRRRWCMSWLPVSRWPQRKPSPAPSPLYDSRTVNRQTAQSDSQRSLQTVTRLKATSQSHRYCIGTQHSNTVLTHWGGIKKQTTTKKISLKHANNVDKTFLIFVRKIQFL